MIRAFYVFVLNKIFLNNTYKSYEYTYLIFSSLI